MLLNLREHIQSLRMLAGLAKFLKHPDSLESVFAIAGGVQNIPLATQMGRYLLNQPGIQAMLADNWRPNPIDLNALEQLPEGSLGHTYAKQLKDQGLTPEALIDPAPITNQREFSIHRLRETHDILHVLTGFSTDGPGELGLQAFNLAQNRSPLAVMLIFGGMLSTLQNDKPLEPLLHALSRGFELGLTANCVISYRLEDHWERPLSEWRQELRLN